MTVAVALILQKQENSVTTTFPYLYIAINVVNEDEAIGRAVKSAREKYDDYGIIGDTSLEIKN
jgi:hypothetical protein